MSQHKSECLPRTDCESVIWS